MFKFEIPPIQNFLSLKFRPRPLNEIKIFSVKRKCQKICNPATGRGGPDFNVVRAKLREKKGM